MNSLADMDTEGLIRSIQDAVVNVDNFSDPVILLYTHEDFYYRSQAEKDIIEELKARGVQVKIRLVAKRGPVRKNTGPWLLAIPMPDWYRDEVIYTKKERV